MRRSLPARAASALVALLLLFGTLRAAVASCCDDDCDLPCCERDSSDSKLLPVLPCCRAVAADQLSTHSAPSLVSSDPAPMAAPLVVAVPLVAVVWASAPSPSLRLLPAPPLYHQHCTLLL